MQIELVAIETPTSPLDGLLYLPEGELRGVVQLMHGNTMNFYVGPPRFLPPSLIEMGLACLAYNRRGHDVLSNRASRAVEGGAFQTIAEAIEDNTLARRWLDRRGFPPAIVVGHSNGGTLGVQHVVEHRDTPALVLLSAHMGGPDLMRTISANGLMAGDRFEEVTARAYDLVTAGRGDELLLVDGWWYVISARTYVEFLDHCPDLLAMAPGIPCPTLFIRSEGEPADLYPAEAVAAASPNPVDVEVLAAGGHYYEGAEDLVAGRVATWLADRLDG